MSFRYHTMRIGAMLLTATRRLLRFSVSGIGLCLVIVFVIAIVSERNIREWIQKGHGFPVISEIQNIELALTKLRSDAGRSSLRDLFERDAFEKVCAWYELQYGADAFEARTVVYTRAVRALLISGRGAKLPDARDDDIMINTRKALSADLVHSLGTSYYSDLGNDPWGNPYQIFDGPWPKEMGLRLLRTYRLPVTPPHLPGDSAPTNPDALTVTIAGEHPGIRGVPAEYTDIYIWSLGANGVSDQPRYDPTHVYAPPARQYYRSDAPDEYLGGGDDINNWDRNQTFMSFYN